MSPPLDFHLPVGRCRVRPVVHYARPLGHLHRPVERWPCRPETPMLGPLAHLERALHALGSPRRCSPAFAMMARRNSEKRWRPAESVVAPTDQTSENEAPSSSISSSCRPLLLHSVGGRLHVHEEDLHGHLGVRRSRGMLLRILMRRGGWRPPWGASPCISRRTKRCTARQPLEEELDVSRFFCVISEQVLAARLGAVLAIRQPRRWLRARRERRATTDERPPAAARGSM